MLVKSISVNFWLINENKSDCQKVKMCAKKRQLSSFSLALLWLENLTTRSKCFFYILLWQLQRCFHLWANLWNIYLNSHVGWALQSSPLRYQCEKTKLSESVARPALANQIEDEKWRHLPSPLDTYLLLEINISSI